MIAALLGFLAAVNPVAAALAFTADRRTDRPVAVAAGAIAAVAALVALAAVSDPLLDAVDVNLGTYRLGAGVVVALCGLRWLVAGPVAACAAPESDRALAVFVCFPVLVTPAAAALAVSVGAEDGVVTALVAAGVAVALGATGILTRRSWPTAPAQAAVRLLGALAVIVGIAIAVDGIKTL